MYKTLLLFLLAGSVLQAQVTEAPPAFSSYPAKIFTGRSAKARIATDDDKRYATQLHRLSGQKPNFAGHYSLATWGCGASCVMAVAMDDKTGKTVWLPFTVCCWNENILDPLEYRRDSRLLIVHGSRNESGMGDYFYEIKDTGFELIKESEKIAH